MNAEMNRILYTKKELSDIAYLAGLIELRKSEHLESNDLLIAFHEMRLSELIAKGE